MTYKLDSSCTFSSLLSNSSGGLPGSQLCLSIHNAKAKDYGDCCSMFSLSILLQRQLKQSPTTPSHRQNVTLCNHHPDALPSQRLQDLLGAVVAGFYHHFLAICCVDAVLNNVAQLNAPAQSLSSRLHLDTKPGVSPLLPGLPKVHIHTFCAILNLVARMTQPGAVSLPLHQCSSAHAKVQQTRIVCFSP